MHLQTVDDFFVNLQGPDIHCSGNYFYLFINLTDSSPVLKK